MSSIIIFFIAVGSFLGTFALYPFFWSRSERWRTSPASYFTSRLFTSAIFSLIITWPFLTSETQQSMVDNTIKGFQKLDEFQNGKKE